MLTRVGRFRLSLLLLSLATIGSLSAFAGSAVIGLVAGSRNATVSEKALVPNTAIFSGDVLRVKDGVAVVAVGGSSRIAFGRETVASFLRDSNEVTVQLSQGNLSMTHLGEGLPIRVKVEDMTIIPGRGFRTLGEVAMVGGAVVVTARDGLLRVERNGSAVEVAKGKSITMPAKVARAPKPAGGGGGVAAEQAWAIAGTAAAGVAAIEGGLAIARANDAKDAAVRAGQLASQAIEAANAAAHTACTALLAISPSAVCP